MQLDRALCTLSSHVWISVEGALKDQEALCHQVVLYLRHALA